MGMKQILVMMVAVVLVGQSVVADEKKLIAAPRRETGPKDLRVLTGEPWLRGIPAGVTVKTRALMSAGSRSSAIRLTSSCPGPHADKYVELPNKTTIRSESVTEAFLVGNGIFISSGNQSSEVIDTLCDPSPFHPVP